MKASRKTLKAKADKLFSEYIRKRDGKCMRCDLFKNRLECNHIVGRRNLRLRYDANNAITLCTACHFWWHENPLKASDWFRNKWPERAKYLIDYKNEIEKPDYYVVIEKLQELLHG